MNKMLQDEQEIAAFASLLKLEGVRSYLEIGAKFGGSLRRVGELLDPGAMLVAVDLPNGTKLWNESRPALLGRIVELNEAGHKASVIWGDSTKPEIIRQVRALGPFDAVLIDANHTRPYVEQDWQNYGHLGRIVAFHDIAWRRAPEWVGTRIDVPEFWNEIKGEFRHEEFKFCPTGKNNGIGVLWRS